MIRLEIIAAVLASMLAAGCAETADEDRARDTRRDSGIGEDDGTGTDTGGGSKDVCAGRPEGCIALCEGGQCQCYCEDVDGTDSETGSGDTGKDTGQDTGSDTDSDTGSDTGGIDRGDAGTMDCDCMRGGYAPMCGVDGKTYDAICGIECVPVDIACQGECPCQSKTCTQNCAVSGLTCCDGSCVNTDNDRTRCGGCRTECSGSTPYCNLGKCEAPPCEPTSSCKAGHECCGSQCCSAGQICCLIMQGPWFHQCVDPVEGTCPVGCPMCVCASPDTMVATPDGERAIAEIVVGDLVYTIEQGSIAVAPVIETSQTPVSGPHHVIRVTLETGRTLEISAPHPTAEGGSFGELAAGQALGGVLITDVEIVPYGYPFTYDILPGSSTGFYFASGVAIGSTLLPRLVRQAR